MYELVADSVALEFFSINPQTGVVTLIKDLTQDSFNGLTYRVGDTLSPYILIYSFVKKSDLNCTTSIGKSVIVVFTISTRFRCIDSGNN